MVSISISLNKLDSDPRNVRQTYNKAGIAELAASLRAEGYQPLQNLIVRKGKKGRYFVIAGERRRRALLLLAGAGEIAADFPVDCKVSDDEHATAISLAENIMREDMHPVDAYQAFSKLLEQGKTITEIAARFGTTELIVKRRLALARVAPELLEAYRDEEIDLDHLQAFTLTDDHKCQLWVWEQLKSNWNFTATAIRRILMEKEIVATDKRIHFIGGMDAYEKAGGAVRRDLFAEENGAYALDVALVERLVLEKMDKLAELLKEEGWKWVETYQEQPDSFYHMNRIYPAAAPLEKTEQAQLNALAAEFDELAALIEGGVEDSDNEKRLAEIEAEIQALEDKEDVFSAKDIARAGAAIWVRYDGLPVICRGIVKPEDEEETERGLGNEAKAEKPVHSAALVEDLTAQKTAALRVELMNNADIALATVVHSLLLNIAYPHFPDLSCLEIRLASEHIERVIKNPDENKAIIELRSITENWGEKIPGNPSDLWEWCFEQPREQLLELLAYAAGHSVNAIKRPHSLRENSCKHADRLAVALNIDMAKWFTPTADNYFSRIGRQTIQATVAEVRGTDFADGISKMKKSEAAVYAESQLFDTGWLPEPVRISPLEKEAM